MAYNRATVDAIRAWLRSEKACPCADCGVQYPYYVMQFDHLPGTEKRFTPADLPWRSWKAAREEIAKCEVVCANCHAHRTWTRADFTVP